MSLPAVYLNDRILTRRDPRVDDLMRRDVPNLVAADAVRRMLRSADWALHDVRPHIRLPRGAIGYDYEGLVRAAMDVYTSVWRVALWSMSDENWTRLVARMDTAQRAVDEWLEPQRAFLEFEPRGRGFLPERSTHAHSL